MIFLVVTNFASIETLRVLGVLGVLGVSGPKQTLSFMIYYNCSTQFTPKLGIFMFQLYCLKFYNFDLFWTSEPILFGFIVSLHFFPCSEPSLSSSLPLKFSTIIKTIVCHLSFSYGVLVRVLGLINLSIAIISLLFFFNFDVLLLLTDKRNTLVWGFIITYWFF